MAKLKRLQDIYRFPGFVPRLKVCGLFGDPRAVVVTLLRRRKKRAAGSADNPFALTTTSDHVASATYPVATNGSSSPSRCDGFTVPGAAA